MTGRQVGFFWMILLMFASDPCAALPAFMRLAGSVPAAGRNQVGTALVSFEDPLAAPLNPAGMGCAFRPSVGKGEDLGIAVSGGGLWRQGYGDLFGKHEFAGLAIRLGHRIPGIGKSVSVAVYQHQFALEDIEEVNRDGVVQGMYGARDAVTGVSLAARVNGLLRFPVGALYVGLLWDHITQEITRVIRNYRGSRGDMVSLGLLHTWSSPAGWWDVRTGLVIRNVLRQIGPLHLGRMRSGSYEEFLERQVDLGLAVQARGVHDATLVAVDVCLPESGGWVLKPAMELRKGAVGQALVGRMGYRFGFDGSEGIGVQEENLTNRLSLGMGLESGVLSFAEFRIDYALELSLGDRSLGNMHQLGVTLAR